MDLAYVRESTLLRYQHLQVIMVAVRVEVEPHPVIQQTGSREKSGGGETHPISDSPTRQTLHSNSGTPADLPEVEEQRHLGRPGLQAVSHRSRLEFTGSCGGCGLAGSFLAAAAGSRGPQPKRFSSP